MDKMLERILEIIPKKHGSKKELADAIGIPANLITDWKAGRAKSYPKYAAAIADYYNVSLDWLSGRSEQKEKRPAVGETLPKNAIMVSCMIPILGTIPAGYPVLACEEILGYAPADVHNPKNYFYLRVNGDSMINAGINTGDLVLIHCQACAEDGQIVACRVNGDEATLKRFRRQGNSIILMPENPIYPPRIVPESDFASGYAAIIGIAVQVTKNLL